MESSVVPAFEETENIVESACSPVENEREEKLICETLGLPAHLALNNNATSPEFEKPQEGFAIHAAFTEAAYALLAEGRIDAAQIGALEKLFTVTLEEELANAIWSTAQTPIFLPKRGGKKKSRGSKGSVSWSLKGYLSSFRKESQKIQIIVNRATLQTEGLVLLSDRLTICSTDR